MNSFACCKGHDGLTKIRKGLWKELRLVCIGTYAGRACNGTKVGNADIRGCICAQRRVGPEVGGPYGPYKQVRLLLFSFGIPV